MKKCISVILAVIFISGVVPNALADGGHEEPKMIIGDARFGEYREERIGNLGEQDSLGMLFFPDREMMYDFDRQDMPAGVSFGKQHRRTEQQILCKSMAD